MKKTEFTAIIFLLILVFTFIVSGCKKEVEILPDYALEWVFESNFSIILLKLNGGTVESTTIYNNGSDDLFVDNLRVFSKNKDF